LSARVYHGWIIVGGAFVVLLLAYGTQYAFGVFFTALLAEFHWSRASLSGAFSLYAFVYSAFGLVAGRLTDRWGPRIVIASGGVLLGAGLAGMSAVTALWQPYVLYGAVAALGMSTAYVPCNATVVRWFVRQRGLAVGVASAGGSVGTFVLPPVAHWLVSALGWRRPDPQSASFTSGATRTRNSPERGSSFLTPKNPTGRSIRPPASTTGTASSRISRTST